MDCKRDMKKEHATFDPNWCNQLPNNPFKFVKSATQLLLRKMIKIGENDFQLISNTPEKQYATCRNVKNTGLLPLILFFDAP